VMTVTRAPKKGARVTVITTLADMRTFLPHIESITSHAP